MAEEQQQPEIPLTIPDLLGQNIDQLRQIKAQVKEQTRQVTELYQAAERRNDVDQARKYKATMERSKAQYERTKDLLMEKQILYGMFRNVEAAIQNAYSQLRQGGWNDEQLFQVDLLLAQHFRMTAVGVDPAGSGPVTTQQVPPDKDDDEPLIIAP